jgi:Adenylate cyclase, class 2 (thermophilic)
MKKTIVKAKLPSRTDFVSALEEIDFKFAAPYWQHDRIFVPRNFDRSKTQPRLSLRTIVKGADKAIYALVLRRHFENSHMDLINATPVTDYAEAAHILYQLGYELKYEVARRREELDMGDTIKIYIDKIDTLQGYYAKIESELDDKDDTKESYEDICETFKVLGVPKSSIIANTYGELLESTPPLEQVGM